MATGNRQRASYEIFLDAKELGVCRRVGTMHRHADRTDLAASFDYDPDWLAGGCAFMLDPRLELYQGEQHPPAKTAAFGSFLDSAPDRWGRVLMERREGALAARESRRMRNLQEVDFLLGVHDITRAGALRFRASSGGPFLDDGPNPAPPFTRLAELADISRRLEEPGVEKLPGYEKWLAMLIAPGTSLGGSRPKASFVDDDGSLWLGKFPAREDRYDIGTWEYLVHQLSVEVGIEVPLARLAHFSPDSAGVRHATFCVQRFDRLGDSRRLYTSAMTLLERVDGEAGSYLDLAEFISDNGAAGFIDRDLKQLFRRVVFNVLSGNRDDHLRNHGFIRDSTGWRLAPAFDVNPNPQKGGHALTLDDRTDEPNLRAVMQTAELYRLTNAVASAILDEIASALRPWREKAQALGLSADVPMMESSFLDA